MKKTLIAAGIAAVMAAPAMADTTVYGKVRQSMENIDNDANTSDAWSITDRASRVGVKGSEDLGNGMTANYQLEWSVDVDDGTFGARNQWVGLKGSFGEVRVGRHDTPYKMAGSAALFNDTMADEQSTSGIIQRNFETRAANTIAYITPTVNGLHAAIAVVPGEETSTVAGTAVADGLSDAVSVAVVYKNGPLSIAGGYEKYDADFATGRTADQTGKKLTASYAAGDLTVAGTIERADDTAGVEDDAYLVSAKYKMGANDLLVSYGEFDDATAGTGDVDRLALGVTHNFSKRTNIQAIYYTDDNQAANTDVDGYGVQLNHSF